MKKELNCLSAKLKDLHGELLQFQTALVEQQDGQRYGPYERLQLAIHDNRFDWIRRLSELITRIDTYTIDRRGRETLDVAAVANEITGLLYGQFPDFARPYEFALNADPRLTITQVEVKNALRAIMPRAESA